MNEQERLNPFLSVWLHPKKTAKYVMEQKGIPYTLFIIAIGYIGSLCAGLLDTELYPMMSLWVILLLLVILSPILGIISNALYSLIVWLIGKLFKGTGTYQVIFKSMSLVAIPYIVLIPFYLMWMFVEPESLFSGDVFGDFIVLPIITLIVTFVVTVWCFVISIAIVAEAHKISNWKAFFTLFIPTIILIIVLVVIFLLIALLILAIGTVFAV